MAIHPAGKEDPSDEENDCIPADSRIARLGRLWSGTRTSLFIGVVVAFFEALISILMGAIWGYVRKPDRLFTEIYNVTYTRALLSAIPLPNPHVEHRKKLLIYDPGVHDYAQNPPDFVEIEPGHFVLANARELETYRRMLDAPAH